MNSKTVPFYQNHEDGMHCMLSVYRSLFEYFLDKKLSWEEIEKLTGYVAGKAAWSVKILTYLSEYFDIKMIEPFDYDRYIHDGEKYLSTVFNAEELEWQLNTSNLLDIKPMIPEFLEKVKPEYRTPTIADIDNMLDDGRLVFVILNSKSLNDKKGYTAHAVLILSHDEDSYVFHDPGLPPKPNRKELKNKVFQAMGGKNNNSEVTGFKLLNNLL